MAEYVYIQNYHNKGKLGISHYVFDDIVESVIAKMQGVQLVKGKKKKTLFSVNKPIHCEIKNGKVTSFIEIKVDDNQDVEKVKANIIEEVESAISIMTELVPFKPVVKVVGVK